MTHTPLQTPRGPPAAATSGTASTSTGSTHLAQQEACPRVVTPSPTSVRFAGTEAGENEGRPGRDDVSSVELLAGKSHTTVIPREVLSETPRAEDLSRNASGLFPPARRSLSTGALRQSCFFERTSTSTETSEGGEDTTSIAAPCMRTLRDTPAASGGAQTGREANRTTAHAGRGVSQATGAGVYPTQRSGPTGAFTRQTSTHFQRQISLTTVKVDPGTYYDVKEDDAEVTFAPKDATGDRCIRPLSVQWQSGALDNEEVPPFVPAKVSVAVVPKVDTGAKQLSDGQDAPVAASNGKGVVHAATSRVDEKTRATFQIDLEGQTVKNSEAKPQETFKSYITDYVEGFTKHPVLDSGRQRAPFSTLRGQLCLMYCTSTAIIVVFVMQLVLDHTTYHGRCMTPILYPNYRLPLQDRKPYWVSFGYGACEYNLGRSQLFRLQSNSTTASSRDNGWPIENVDNTNALDFGELNAWEISAIGGLDANKIRNYGEYFRLFTSIFLHGSWLHLVTNLSCCLLLLWMIEPVWGFLRTTLTFFVSGITSSLCAAVLCPCTISVGASGALYGLIGALLPFSIEFWDYLEYPVWLLTLVLSGLTVCQAFNFFVFSNVDNWAHVSGFFAGTAFGFATIKSLHSWRWEGVRERLASLEAFSWAFSQESGERLRDANRKRVQRYRRRRRSGKPYWPKVVWKWKGHEIEWSVRLLCSAVLMPYSYGVTFGGAGIEHDHIVKHRVHVAVTML